MVMWSELLRQARRRAGQSQAGLAAAAGASVETVSNYERGIAQPTREMLLRFTRAMRLDREATNAILSDARFEPLPTGRLGEIEDRRLPLESLQEEIAAYPWPVMVNNELMEIMAWNEPAVRVAELDFARVLPLPYQRNLMRIAAMPHFRDRVQNWEAVIAPMIAMIKGEGMNPGQPEGETSYFNKLVNDLAREAPDAFAKMMQMWVTTTNTNEEPRVTLNPIWRVSDDTTLRFNTVLTNWSDYDAVWAFDWHPADGETWNWLRRTAPPDSDVAEQPTSTVTRADEYQGIGAHEAVSVPHEWWQLLRAAREGAGLTRRALSDSSGVTVPTIEKYEYGRSREPERDIILWLARALELDGATTNVILSRAGLGREPSEWSRIVAGLPASTKARFRYRDELELRNRRANVRRDIEAHTWPCIIVNDRCDIILWNAAAARVFGPGGVALLRQRGGRNLARFALSGYFRERVLNWDEVVTALVPGGLREQVGGGRRGGPRYLQRLVERLREEEPALLRRLEELWQAAPPPTLMNRVVTPLLWGHADDRVLTFNCLVAPWTTVSRLWAIDWHPADKATWDWFDEGREGRSGRTGV